MSRIRLESERLVIRPFTMADLDAAQAILSEPPGWEQTLDLRREWLEWTVRNYIALARLYQPPYGDYAVDLKATGELIGSVGIVPSLVPWGVFAGDALPEDARYRLQPEMGLFWIIAQRHQRHGYAAEAASAVVRYLLDEMKVCRVVATTERENLASQAVMKKLGMDVRVNPGDQPFWFEVVGVLERTAKS